MLHQAFERVRENGGCRGCDGTSLGEFADRLEWELDDIEASLRARRYQPLPLLRFAVPKPSGGLRQLSVPTVRDRVVQSAVYLVTYPVFEAEWETASFAYRQGRSVRDAVRRIAELRDQGYRWVMDADIDAFLDSIPHPPLLTRLARLPLDPYILELFNRWVQAEIYDGERVTGLAAGIPQGSVVSPMLANLFLDELDENLALFEQKLVRYADDFVVLCRDEGQAAQALELTDYLLAELGLDLNREKSHITSFRHGFKFLGALFVGDSVYLPLEHKHRKRAPLQLPRPLDLVRYLELKHAGAGGAA